MEMKPLILIFFLILQSLIYAQQKANIPEIFTITEVMPEYPGGSAAMMKFIMHSISIPEQSNAKGCLKFNLKFIVYEDGSIHNPTFLIPTGFKEDLDREILRVIANMPRWKPAKMKGKAVKCYYSLPLRITIE